jgi:hypothetical protein
MAQLAQAFDPSTAPADDRNFDLIPSGWQPMHAIETDVGPTKDGNGQVLVVTWEILEGPFAKRRIWSRINIANPSAQAQEIGQRDLGSICKALGLGPISDSKEIEFKPLQGRVGVEPGQNGYEAKNKVSAFKAYGAAGSPPSARAAQPQTTAAPQTGQATGGGARPWAK